LTHFTEHSLSNSIDKHRVRILSDFSEVDEIYSLRIYMYSIFYNLIGNSIKYGKPNVPPLIEIKSRKENGKIILTFKDNGLGIDMKTNGDKIFGLYRRFHSHVEGKGMGLFMVKTQVESLGGRITVASEVNKGTEFTLVFEN
jgi:signal transduction histidine kinase